MSVDGVNPEVLADFAAIRKAKRKGPVTTAVIEAVCQQAHLAGLTLEQALQTCCDPRRRWAHAAIEKHQFGQPVRRAVLLDTCAALRLNPASLSAARMH